MKRTEGGSCWAHFDYEKMAREARQERDNLQRIMRSRKEQGPGSLDRAMVWDQENRRYYDMYLEQRKNVMEFERRAEKRRAYGA